MFVSRREILAGLPLFAAGCASRRAAVAIPPPPLPYAPVIVSPDRVIRVTVGLRPFRPSGFVVRADKLGDKTVVHNYGHGGAGITLSWGTAQLAVIEGAKTGARTCAVLGSGIAGLSTARLLQLRGYNPVIYTRDMPPSTTSNLAGGLWEPVSLYDRDRVTPDFRRQFVEASRFSFRYFQSLAGDRYGVRWMPLFALSTDGPFHAPASENPASEIESLYPEPKQIYGSENPFGVPYVYRRQSMLIEPAIYLNTLMRDFRLSGGRVVIRDFNATADVLALDEALIFNCTGFGARTLFGDEELIPIRGQLVFLLPQPEVNYMTLGPSNIYMFPRHDGILLGGSFDRGDTNLEPDAAITARILNNSKTLFESMKTAQKT